MKAPIFGGLLAISATVFAQDAASPTASPALKIYTSPDGTFQFTYPAFLIRCELKQQNNGEGYYWAQPDCNSSHPVCEVPNPNQPMVGIAYPRDTQTGPTSKQPCFRLRRQMKARRTV